MNDPNDTAAKTGTLYVVATPIGNMGDLSHRAIEVLAAVPCIAAEDTRHSRRLLQHYGLRTPLTPLHEHNERDVAPALVEQLLGGQSLALISDAGTPLISDPGFNLIRLARRRGVPVVPIPGPCALVSALSVAGLPTDRFVFEGFLPSRRTARRARLEELREETRTLVLYESSHRIVECLNDLRDVLGEQRKAVLARELTKQFETVKDGTLDELCDLVAADPNQRKGEFVVLIQGLAEPRRHELTAEAEKILSVLLAELPIKTAAKLAAQITGVNKRLLYDKALELKGD
jgi:16S rRNA (cytidine1402-2'-O)-methyltransferase